MSQGPPRPSATALAVARAFTEVLRRKEWAAVAPKDCPQQTAALLESIVPALSTRDRFLQSAPMRAISRALDRSGPLKGGTLHLALRKRWIEDRVRQAIADGFTQLCVLGAGYDLLAWRIAREFPQVLCFEVDTKATQREKYKALLALSRSHGLKDLPPNLDLFILDLSQGAVDRALLAQKTVDRTRPTLFIAEGVLMYLSENDARQVLQSMKNVAVPRARILFSYLGADASGKPLAGDWDRAMKAIVKIAGEPFRFAIPQGRLESLLSEYGLALTEQVDEASLLALYAKSTPPSHAGLDWEYLASAERMS
jgi:methyltransferase (TIGR00027 family)